MLSDGFHVRKEVPSAVASPLAAPVFPMTTSKALPPGVPMRTRRELLHLLAATGAATTLGLYARPARAADGSWDVSYIWAPDLDAVLDYREEVADALGPDVAKDLAYVQLAIPHELPQGWRLLDSVTQRAVELLLVEQAEHLASAPPKPIDQPT